LRRELREELGIDVAVGDCLAEVEHDYPDRRVRLQFFRCTLLHGEPVPIECQSVAWIDCAGLDRYRFPAADAQLVARLRESPEWWREGG
jgi:A/G-specific adenine glycosylase